MTLTLERAIQIAPSIGAIAPANHVSSEYRFMPTHKFIGAFMEAGWEISDAKQIKARKRDPMFSKHMVSLQHPDFGFTNNELGTIRPRLTVINSHDWSSRLQVLLGMFRLICTNGMVIETGKFTGLNVRHDADLGVTLEDISTRFKGEASRLIETSNRWRAIDLSPVNRMDFVNAAGRLRWGDEYVPNTTPLDISRRIQDTGHDLWNTFNRVQENLMRGGAQFNGNRRARAISNIDAERDINTQLWNLAEDFSNRLN